MQNKTEMREDVMYIEVQTPNGVEWRQAVERQNFAGKHLVPALKTGEKWVMDHSGTIRITAET